MAAPKPHAVCVPYPAQGHVTPMMQLAKLLHSRGFHITFVNTEFNHRRLLRSKGPDSLKGFDDFRFETIPDGLPPSDKDATQDVPALCESTKKTCLTPLVHLVKRLNSTEVMTEKQLTKFAWGLANSNHHFLWIIRPDAVTVPVPEEFIIETKDRGMLTGWCPQDVVLSHPSVGLFLIHCGWNSTLETICGGVPVICWPYFAEQQTNCWYACNVWEIGMESNNDVRREELEELVKEMMNGEKGKKMRKNALDLKQKTQEATREGGSSYKNFDVLVKEMLRI